MTQQSGSGASSGLSENLASALSYIPIVGLVFLLIEPYNRNRTVRFHAFQSLLLFVAAIVVQIVYSILFGILYAIMPFSWMLLSGIGNLISLAFFIVFVVAAVKAFQGSSFEIPVIADYAHKYA